MGSDSAAGDFGEGGEDETEVFGKEIGGEAGA